MRRLHIESSWQCGRVSVWQCVRVAVLQCIFSRQFIVAAIVLVFRLGLSCRCPGFTRYFKLTMQGTGLTILTNAIGVVFVASSMSPVVWRQQCGVGLMAWAMSFAVHMAGMGVAGRNGSDTTGHVGAMVTGAVGILLSLRGLTELTMTRPSGADE